MIEMANKFSRWCSKALTPTSQGSLLNAVKTSLAHVKVEQIMAGCHIHAPFDVELPISVSFRRFVRGKPIISSFQPKDTICVEITQCARKYYVTDSGLPLDIANYCCPVYPYTVYPRNYSGDWIFTVEEIETLNSWPVPVRIGAIFRLYANMALTLAEKQGLANLVNISMDNTLLYPTRLLSGRCDTTGKTVKRVNFTYSFWKPSGNIISTGKSAFIPKFSSEFYVNDSGKD